MKFEIYRELQDPEEKLTRLRLMTVGNEAAYVAVVDNTGRAVERGYLVKLTENGGIHRCTNVNESLGFVLDESKRVKEVG